MNQSHGWADSRGRMLSLYAGLYLLLSVPFVAAASLTTKEKLQSELIQGVLNAQDDTRQGNPSRYGDYMRERGWKRLIYAAPDFGVYQAWDYGYMVFRKGSHYGVVITRPGADPQATRINRIPLINAEALVGIPNKYVPSLDCIKLVDWLETKRRCKASRGEDCMVGTPPVEMLAFVKVEKRCSQDGSNLHSAYRYDDIQKRLLPIPTEGWLCIIEDVRPRDCTPLVQ